MALYEDRVAENILEEELQVIDDATNKQEGSIAYTMCQANAEKLEDVYIDMETQNDNLAADTMDREHLIRRAAERGLMPKSATAAVYRLSANCTLEVGDRFACDEYTFVITEAITETTFKLQCEQTGTGANYFTGQKPEYLGYNEELETATLNELIVTASDEEDTESFRERYFDSVNTNAFAGNVAAYIEAMKNVEGVTAAKLDPLIDEGIKGIIMATGYSKASDELVKVVQDEIDPETDVNNWCQEYGLPTLESYKGKGFGKAPIDHSVLITSVEEKEVNISMSLTYQTGYSWQTVKEAVEKAIDAYLLELRKAWQQTAYTTVRASRIVSCVIAIAGIEDVTDVKVEDSEHLTLAFEQIPVRGVVSVV